MGDKMEIDIRKAIINNFKESSTSEIESSITESIKLHNEITLPGLGVFFELLWNESSKDEQKTIVESIKNAIQ